LTLTVVEIGGNSDYSILDGLTKEALGSLLHLCKDEATDLRGRELLVTSLYPCVSIGVLHDLEGNFLDILLHFGIRELSSDETLSGEKSILRVYYSLTLGWDTNQSRMSVYVLSNDLPFAVFGKCNNGRSSPATLTVLQHTRSLALHDSNT